MLIFDENDKPVIIDNINGPIISDYFWILDLDLDGDIDYTLTPLQFIEETTCPSLKIMIEGYAFFVPAHWNILVVDDDTTELDAIPIEQVTGKKFTAVISGPAGAKTRAAEIVVVDYVPDHKNVGPWLKKHHMLCHPINSNSWINIAPSDCYKYIKDYNLGDLT